MMSFSVRSNPQVPTQNVRFAGASRPVTPNDKQRLIKALNARNITHYDTGKDSTSFLCRDVEGSMSSPGEIYHTQQDRNNALSRLLDQGRYSEVSLSEYDTPENLEANLQTMVKDYKYDPSGDLYTQEINDGEVALKGQLFRLSDKELVQVVDMQCNLPNADPGPKLYQRPITWGAFNDSHFDPQTLTWKINELDLA
jgi:hypothetical protein